MATQKTTNEISITSAPSHCNANENNNVSTINKFSENNHNQMDPTANQIDSMTNEEYKIWKNKLLQYIPPTDIVVNANSMKTRRINQTYVPFQHHPLFKDPDSAKQLHYFKQFRNWTHKTSEPRHKKRKLNNTDL
eukprot:282748_1